MSSHTPPPIEAGPTSETGPVRWHRIEGTEALQDEAARWILAAAARAIAARGRFIMVLAGGNTPRGVYARLRDADIDWARWHLWFGDERCLPGDDPERNSVMAHDAWLAHVPIPAAQIHVIPAEQGADTGAASYARMLGALPDDDADQFDLVLLGLGEDGHTASLFPGQDWGVEAHSPDALGVHDAPKPPSERVSLSVARLTRTREALFLVDGEGKRDAVNRWRAGNDIPARAIRPPAGVDVLVEASLVPAT
ncbi:MAG: 6-phosphogluconolactonase [Lysobacter sp.]